MLLKKIALLVAGVVMSASWTLAATSTDELWVLRDGSVTFQPNESGLAHLGVHVEVVGLAAGQELTLGVDGVSDLAAVVLGDTVESLQVDYLGLNGALRLSTSSREVLVVGLLLDEPSLGVRADVALARGVVGDDAVLVLRGLRAGVDRRVGRITLPSMTVVISPALAEALGDPTLSGESIGSAVVRGMATPVGDTHYQPMKPTVSELRQTEGLGSVAAGGADMTFCQLFDLRQFGRTSTTLGLAVATTSWNVGTADLMWFQNPDARHPYIVSNLYRLKDDRFEQIGQSWIKHGFFALSSEQCGTTCTYEPGHGVGDWLGVGCTDTYTSGLNATQSGLGPRYEINPWTGNYRYAGSHLSSGHSHDAIEHRLQVAEADLIDGTLPPAQFFVDGYYVVRDDVNHTNSVSWKPVSPSGVPGGTWSFGMSNEGVRPNTGYALDAWVGARQTVIAQDIPPVEFVSPDGRCILASKVTNLGGGMWHYEYALYNFDMNRKVLSFSVPTAQSANIQNVGFHAVQSHNEPFSNTPWTASIQPGSITWSTVDNPIRWGTMYNFRFDVDADPIDVTVTLGLYEPGTPDHLTGITDGPNTAGATCSAAAPPIADISGIANNRFLSVTPGNPGQLTAIRVRLSSLLHPPAPIPPGTPDYSGFEGQTMWVGAPVEFADTPAGSGTFMAAMLQCTPEFRDWSTFGEIHIYGPEIMPHSVYDVQEIHTNCQASLNLETAYSPPLVVPTAYWGDVVAPFAGDPGAGLPVDFNDITATVSKFLGDPEPGKVRTKLTPGTVDPALNVDFKDITATVQGFLGNPYLQDGPRTCP